jgi:hypothetical protein
MRAKMMIKKRKGLARPYVRIEIHLDDWEAEFLNNAYGLSFEVPGLELHGSSLIDGIKTSPDGVPQSEISKPTTETAYYTRDKMRGWYLEGYLPWRPGPVDEETYPEVFEAMNYMLHYCESFMSAVMNSNEFEFTKESEPSREYKTVASARKFIAMAKESS